MSKSYERRVDKPIRGLDVAGDFIVPVGWCIVAGALAGALALLVSGEAKAFGVVGASVALVVAFWWLNDSTMRSHWASEVIYESEGVEAMADPAVVRVEIQSGRTLSFMDVEGLDVVRLQQFAHLALEGRLTERQVRDVVGLARGDWQQVRDTMMSRGLLTWNNANSRRHGISVTRRGAEAFGGILDGARLLSD